MSSAAQPPTESAADRPAQHFGTAGIKPMARPSLATRAFMRIVAFVERLNLKYSKVGNPPIYDKAVFPWTAEVERDWRAIRAELDRVLTRKDELPGFHELSTDVATISTGPRLEDLPAVRLRLPLRGQYQAAARRPGRICQKIPGLITVMFSILEPGKHLPPHRGPYNGVLRLHLGLIVPEPRDAARHPGRPPALPLARGRSGGVRRRL